MIYVSRKLAACLLSYLVARMTGVVHACLVRDKECLFI